MIYIVRALLICILFSSCSLLNKGVKTDKSILTEDIKKEVVFRPSDKVTNTTAYNIIHKDTTIVTTNYDTKTILREVYDQVGNKTTECICDEIKHDIEVISRKLDNDIHSQKEFNNQINLTPMIWAIVGMGGVLLLVIIVVLIMMTKFQKSIPNIVASSINSIK